MKDRFFVYNAKGNKMNDSVTAAKRGGGESTLAPYLRASLNYASKKTSPEKAHQNDVIPEGICRGAAVPSGTD